MSSCSLRFRLRSGKKMRDEMWRHHEAGRAQYSDFQRFSGRGRAAELTLTIDESKADIRKCEENLPTTRRRTSEHILHELDAPTRERRAARCLAISSSGFKAVQEFLENSPNSSRTTDRRRGGDLRGFALPRHTVCRGVVRAECAPMSARGGKCQAVVCARR